MRILFITQFFHPEPFFRGLPFARALADRGHEVEVLTGFPNYPGGKLYEGYAVRPLQRETLEGIPVIRVPLYPSHDRSSLRRSFNYLSFLGTAGTLGASLVSPADVAYVYHPPITTGLAALSVKLTRGIPYVYDVQDLWPDALATTGMVPAGLMRAINAGCQAVYQQAARISVLSPGFKRSLVARGIEPEKIEVIYNWCDEEALGGDEPTLKLAEQEGLSGKFNVVFAGNMGSAQALDSVLDAAALLRDELPKVQFVLMGGGLERDALQGSARARALTNVRFLAYRPQSEAGKILRLADVLLVHLRDAPLFDITIPSKTQAYLAQGKPVIVAVRGDAAELVIRAGAGLACRPQDPEDLAAAVRRLYRLPTSERTTMGRRARDFYGNELSMAVGVDRFISVFEQVARAVS